MFQSASSCFNFLQSSLVDRPHVVIQTGKTSFKDKGKVKCMPVLPTHSPTAIENNTSERLLISLNFKICWLLVQSHLNPENVTEYWIGLVTCWICTMSRNAHSCYPLPLMLMVNWSVTPPTPFNGNRYMNKHTSFTSNSVIEMCLWTNMQEIPTEVIIDWLNSKPVDHVDSNTYNQIIHATQSNMLAVVSAAHGMSWKCGNVVYAHRWMNGWVTVFILLHGCSQWIFHSWTQPSSELWFDGSPFRFTFRLWWFIHF